MRCKCPVGTLPWWVKVSVRVGVGWSWLRLGHGGRGSSWPGCWSLHRAAHTGADTQLETERSSAALGSCCSVLGASQHARIPRVITHGCAGPGLVTAAVPTRAVKGTSRNFTVSGDALAAFACLLQILGVAHGKIVYIPVLSQHIRFQKQFYM